MWQAIQSRRTRPWTMWLVATGLLAGCTTAPIGRLPEYQGTYLQNALVTNPHSDGPHAVIWGPPPNYNPSGHD